MRVWMLGLCQLCFGAQVTRQNAVGCVAPDRPAGPSPCEPCTHSAHICSLFSRVTDCPPAVTDAPGALFLRIRRLAHETASGTCRAITWCKPLRKVLGSRPP